MSNIIISLILSRFYPCTVPNALISHDQHFYIWMPELNTEEKKKKRFAKTIQNVTVDPAVLKLIKDYKLIGANYLAWSEGTEFMLKGTGPYGK